MPYMVRKQGDQFCVYKESGGESLGCHPTEGEAQSQIAAIYANEGKSKKGKFGGSIGDPVANLAARAEMSLMKLGQYARPVSAMAGKLDALAFATNDRDRAETLREMANQARMLSAYLRNAAGYRIPDKLPSLVDGINRITNILRSQALPLYRVFLDYSERIPRESWRQAEQGQSLRVGNEIIITINVLQRFLKEARMLNASHGNETPGVLSVGKPRKTTYGDPKRWLTTIQNNLQSIEQSLETVARRQKLGQTPNQILARSKNNPVNQALATAWDAFGTALSYARSNMHRSPNGAHHVVMWTQYGIPYLAQAHQGQLSNLAQRTLITARELYKTMQYSHGQDTPGVLHTERFKMTKTKNPTRKGQSAKIFGFGKPKLEQRIGDTGQGGAGLQKLRQKLQYLQTENEWVARNVWMSKLRPALTALEEGEAVLPGTTFGTLASLFRVATALLDQIYRKNESEIISLQQQLGGKSVTAKNAKHIAAAKSLRVAAVKARQHVKQFPSRYPSAPDALGLGREGAAYARQRAKEQLAYYRHMLNGWKTENEYLDSIYSQHINALLSLVTKAEQADPTSQKYANVFQKLRQADSVAVRLYQSNQKKIAEAKQIIDQIVQQYGR